MRTPIAHVLSGDQKRITAWTCRCFRPPIERGKIRLFAGGQLEVILWSVGLQIRRQTSPPPLPALVPQGIIGFGMTLGLDLLSRETVERRRRLIW